MFTGLTPRSSALQQSLLKSSKKSLSDKSLPEGDIVSSCLSHIQGASSRSFSGDPSAGETSIGSMLSVYSIGEFKPSSYAVHNARLSQTPTKLEESFDRIFPRPGKDQVLLVGKDKYKTERLLRLAVHTLSYADWYSLALVQNSNLPLSEEKTAIMDRLVGGLDQSHCDCSALLLCALSNFFTARRTSVLKAAPASFKKSIKDKLLSAPLSGPTLFGGVVPSVIDDIANEPRSVTVSVSNPQLKRSAPASSVVPIKRRKTRFKRSASKTSKKFSNSSSQSSARSTVKRS